MSKPLPDRLPPHSQEAEQGVLGCCLIDPSTVLPLCIEKLKDGALTFYDLRHQEIFSTMLELSEDGIPIDIISLQERLKVWSKLEQVGGLTYISTLPDAVPSAANIDYYLELLLEKYVMRRMIATCTDVVKQIYEHEGDVDTLMDVCERDVLRISESREEAPNLSMPSLVNQVLYDIERAQTHQGTPSGLTTGFHDLDRLTAGMHPGDMIVLAARPAMGKSSLAMNIAEHVVCDLHLGVGVCSLEMTAKSLVNRVMASRARVNLRDIRDGYLSQQDIPKITSAAGQLAHAPLYIDDSSGQSIMQIRAKFRRWKQQHDIKLGIIDYLQLANALGGKRKFESRQQEVSDISCGVKNIAKELGIPIIVLSQMNREFEKEKNRKPRLADLRESGSIEQDADVVTFLYRPQSEFDDDDPDKLAFAVNLLIAKQRNGASNVDVPLTFFRTFTRFETSSQVSDNDVPEQSPQTSSPYADGTN